MPNPFKRIPSKNKIDRTNKLLHAYENGEFVQKVGTPGGYGGDYVAHYLVQLNDVLPGRTIGSTTPSSASADLVDGKLQSLELNPVTVYNFYYQRYEEDSYQWVEFDPTTGRYFIQGQPLPHPTNIMVKTNADIAEGTTNLVRSCDATIQTVSGGFFANATADADGLWLGMQPDAYGADDGHVTLFHWYRAEIVSGSYVQAIWMYDRWYSNGIDCLVS